MTRRRPGRAQADADDGAARLRLDRWLWHVRAFRSRSLAAARVEAGGVRINGQPCRKPGRMVGPGDVVTFPAGGAAGRVLTYQVLAVGERRGPATEAATLYRDLSAADKAGPAAPADDAAP